MKKPRYEYNLTLEEVLKESNKEILDELEIYKRIDKCHSFWERILFIEACSLHMDEQIKLKIYETNTDTILKIRKMLKKIIQFKNTSEYKDRRK